jgi:hypothetical protein
MRVNTIIVDDFYSNPDEVREFALSQDFSVKGNYPGYRTIPFLNESTKQGIQEMILPIAGQIVDWGEQYSGCFQLCTAGDRTWIHADVNNTWAGVLYLTPDAPLSGGTAFYKHKWTGDRTEDSEEQYEPRDLTKWDVVDQVGNVFNRLVLYRGDLFHASVDYFGSGSHDGRLIQTFFFSTER